MDNGKQRRKNTRTKVWADTEASLKVADPYSTTRQILTIKGHVNDIGSTGMFFVTEEAIPIPAKAEITINFDPKHPSKESTITVEGETVRKGENGVGIRFTSIDMEELHRCIMARMNRS